MATQVRAPFVHTELDDQLHKRVAGSAESLLRAVSRIEDLAGLKQFVFTSATLVRFDRNPTDGHGRKPRTVAEKTIVVETHAWQIYGSIQGRIINAVSLYRFYTHEDNRSGHGESSLNGKSQSLKPEYGGVTLDDLWQDADLWRGAREAALEGAA